MTQMPGESAASPTSVPESDTPRGNAPADGPNAGLAAVPGSDAPNSEAASRPGPLLLVLEHDASDPPMRLGDWLTEVGARLEVRRLHAGDEVPSDAGGYQGIVSLGGEMGARDDDVAPWLPAVRKLLARAVADRTPTLGICLGAQLLAAATGGQVLRGDAGPEIGAYLLGRRDAADTDPLFVGIPMTPDVMHYHYDVVSVLPPGAVLLLTGAEYPNQAFRVGSAAWGLQFHIETRAADLRGWGGGGPHSPSGRLGAMLDDAEQTMGEVWRDFAHRFVTFAENAAGGRIAGQRLTLLPMEPLAPAHPHSAPDYAIAPENAISPDVEHPPAAESTSAPRSVR